MVGENRDCRAEQEGVWTIVAHNSRAGGRVCRKEVCQKREDFASNRLAHIVGVELLST
jgi:hypothetical protein